MLRYWKLPGFGDKAAPAVCRLVLTEANGI